LVLCWGFSGSCCASRKFARFYESAPVVKSGFVESFGREPKNRGILKEWDCLVS
jgi:hypothetical protein